ncbi:MAG: hypothetical protein RJB01_223, partial [Actinomycetota bacterium]
LGAGADERAGGADQKVAAARFGARHTGNLSLARLQGLKDLFHVNLSTP